jgi:hypothetical protein
VDETDYEKMAERYTKALVESMKQTISEHMTLAWYDPTNHHVSTDKHDPLFTPLGQLWPLGRIDAAVEDDLNNVRYKANYRYDNEEKNT